MKISDLKDKNITIINDSDAPQDKDKDGRNIYILKILKDMDIVIRSPGVSIYKPEIIYAKKEYNTVFITEKTLFFSEIEDSNVKTIAITGTKGKTTTSTFLSAKYLNITAVKISNSVKWIPFLSAISQTSKTKFEKSSLEISMPLILIRSV